MFKFFPDSLQAFNPISILWSPFCLKLRWRHNGHGGVSNHRPHHCLLDRLFGCRSKNTSKLRVPGLCVGNSPGNSPHKWPVTRKMFPFDDVTMFRYLPCRCNVTIMVNVIIVARLKEPRDHNVGILENKSTLLTISRLWRNCGPSSYRFNFLLYWYAPWVFFCEVVNVLSCSPSMFENTENKQLGWRIRHSHLAATLFHSLVPWWRPRRIRPQITRLSQLENSAMGTWPIYKNYIIPDWFEKWRDMNSDTGVNCVVPQNYDVCPLLMMQKTCSINYGHLADLQNNTSYNWS